MSSPEPYGRRIGRVAAAVLLCGLLAGCFRPLYASRADDSSVATQLADIHIAEAETRPGQKIRNELIFAFTGGGEPAGAAYLLEFSVNRGLLGLLVQPNRDSDLRALRLEVSFKLSDKKTGKTIFSGKTVSRASYEHDKQLFSNERALIDAEDRAARVVADDIRTRVSAFFASQV